MTGIEVSNIFERMPGAAPGSECAEEILVRPGLKMERIVSHAHVSPPGFWYEQAGDEWVIVLAGCAKLRFEDESEARPMNKGDYVFIPAGARHRVDWTSESEPTLWLALHFDGDSQR